MSKLTQTPPLIDLNPRTSIQEVQLYLKEPIIPRAGSRRKRLGMQALNAFARLELLLSKEEALKDGMSEKAKKALTSEIGCTVATLEAALAQHFEGQNVYMQEMNLSTVFPKSAKRAGAGNGAPATRDIHSHFQQMSLTNQLVSMALQLQHDLKLTNHKYMAHQVALLYQCINQMGGSYLKYKSRVESRFDEVKSLTNRGEEPLLSAELREWLRGLTTDIVTEALFTSKPLPAQSLGLVKFLDKLREPSPDD
ncbi:hypothetical protein BC936DRAFT_146085 [Jimgerdemannia flammicorona]|uniref:Uncharacterized protein n=1 Tax=Jimgerdemannia flammicorona TaxID=994334 RepID=A0A433D8D1_9FUNG|nr:hypothetical protein BC936DRAFT_146085 [Jimgerdemannia flammicorona]